MKFQNYSFDPALPSKSAKARSVLRVSLQTLDWGVVWRRVVDAWNERSWPRARKLRDLLD